MKKIYDKDRLKVLGARYIKREFIKKLKRKTKLSIGF